MRRRRGTPGSRLPAEVYVFAALTLISFSFLFVSTRDLMFTFRDAGLSFFSGIRGGVHNLSSLVTRTVLSVQELARPSAEHAEALERLARYERLERDSARLREENLRLREQLDFSQSLTYRHIPAELIGRDPDNLFSALVINKGSRSGVQKDMAVIAWQDGNQALVGKVVRVRAYESLVMPLYDTSLLVSARFSDSRYEGITEGQGSPDSLLRMRFIPKRARDEIGRGDLVISSGMGGIYPPNISIGRVSSVIFYEHEISMEAELEPLIDFSRLEYVFVIERQDLREEADALQSDTALQTEDEND
jgi:rod shape-determining protein MreC